MRASAGGPPRYRRPTPRRKTMRPRKRLDLRQARHRPVRIHQFAQHCKRRQTRQLHRIDTAFGYCPRRDNTPFSRATAETHDPAVPDHPAAAPSAIAAPDSREPVGGGNPRRHPARRLDRHRKRRTETARIARHHRAGQGQTPCRIRFHTQTDDPAARTDHQRQLSHRHFRRGKYRISSDSRGRHRPPATSRHRQPAPKPPPASGAPKPRRTFLHQALNTPDKHRAQQ